MIRALEPSDIYQLKDIHKKYFSQEFSFPDFYKNFICAYVITNDNGRIISVGGVRPIAEAITITDQSLTTRERRQALYSMLDTSVYFTAQQGFDQLHAFVQNPEWVLHLKKVGFNSTKGQSLVLDMG